MSQFRSRRQNRKKGRTRCSEGKYLPKQEEICRKLEKYVSLKKGILKY